MNRREFITLPRGAVAAWPLAARGQQSDRMRRIGVLTSFASDDPAEQTRVLAFAQALAALQTLRHMLHSKGAQVQREIVQYSTLTTAALHSTKIIAESLTQLKKAPDAPTPPDLKDRSVAS